jgi:hypothetical protein
MNRAKKAIIALLVVALVITAGAVYVLIQGFSTGPRITPRAALHGEVIGDGHTIRITLVSIDESDVDFQSCKISVVAPNNQTSILDLKNITWVGNNSAIYPMPGGYGITLNRTGPHDHWSSGDRIEVSAQSGKLANGNWGITIVYIQSGGPIAYVQQIIN